MFRLPVIDKGDFFARHKKRPAKGFRIGGHFHRIGKKFQVKGRVIFRRTNAENPQLLNGGNFGRPSRFSGMDGESLFRIFPLFNKKRIASRIHNVIRGIGG